VEGLLARAYTAERTLELRLPGAAHAQLSTHRGAGEASKHPELLEARAALAGRARSGGEDPNWLILEGRAALLVWDFEEAIARFERVREMRPGDRDALLGLATAYYQRGRSSERKRAEDFGLAADTLLRLTAAHPDDSVALFNLALIYEQLQLRSQAVETWKRFLSVEKDPAWKEEGRQNLARIEALGRSAPTGTTAEAALAVAVSRTWPAACEGDPLAASALSRLAIEFRRDHRDLWLADTIAVARPGGSCDPAKQLAAAAEANARGEADVALRTADSATADFAKLGTAALKARALFERALALHRLFRSQECVDAAGQALSAARERYPWIAAQALIEQGVCGAMSGNIGAAADRYREAIGIAERSRYPDTAMRAMSLAAGLYTVIGDRTRSWEDNLRVLARYAGGAYSPLRAYQSYSSLRWMAEQDEWWHIAAALQREAIGYIGATGNKPTEALARFKLAALERLAGDGTAAAKELERAQTMLAGFDGELGANYTLDAHLNLVEAALNEGSTGGWTAAALEKLRPRLQTVSSKILAQQYHRVLGRLQWASGDKEAARETLMAGLRVAEQSSESLRDWRERASWERSAAPIYRGLVEAAAASKDFAAAHRVWQSYMGEAPAGAGGTVLSFVDLSDSVMILLADGRGVFGAISPMTRREIAAASAEFNRACRTPMSQGDALRRTGARLYDALMAPVAGRLDGVRVLLVRHDESTARIPFAALPVDGNSYLGERFAIAVLTGSGQASKVEVHAGAPALAISTSGASPRFPPLSGVVDELSGLRRFLRNSRMMSGGDITFEKLRRAIAAAEVFHFAGHGIAGPDEGALVLQADDERPVLLGSWDVGRLRLPRAKLAVLAACETAAGQRSPWNPNSLVRAFRAAGFQAVLGSGWKVESSSTGAFMTSFYGRLSRGSAVVEAVAAAAAELRSQPSRSHPFYWAGFQVYL
jgi:CHAT domain-containing protein